MFKIGENSQIYKSIQYLVDDKENDINERMKELTVTYSVGKKINK